MKIKILGILVVTLLITTTLPVVSAMNNIINRDTKQIDESINQDYIPEDIIVKFKEKSLIESKSVVNLFEKHQIRSIEKVFKNSENTKLGDIYLLKVSKDSDILSIVEDFSSCPDVEYAETNGLSQSACVIPNDANFSEQWALDNIGQTGGTEDCDIDAPEVWDVVTGSSEIVIAVIDSGIDYNHPDLIDNIWVNDDEIPDNEIDDDDNGFVDDVFGWDWWYDDNDPLDDMGHGTFCAGIVGAVGNNGIGGSGVCWNCPIMSLKIMNDTGWTYYIDMARSIEYAVDNGADVISMSWRLYLDKKYIRDAVNYAYGKGVMLVGGAGNENTSNEAYPAAYDNVTAVAGTDHNDNRMNYYCDVCQEYHSSNYGSWVDVAAPAIDIFSTMPTYHVWFNDLWGGKNQNYDIMPYGTSWSTPYVAGVAALMLSKDSTLTPDEIKSNIKKYSDPYDSEYDLGDGRVNAYRAVKNTRPRNSFVTFFTDNMIFKKSLINILQNILDMFPILERILEIMK